MADDGSPTWSTIISTAPDNVRQLLTSPKTFVLGTVLTAIVSGVLDMGREVIRALNEVAEPIIDLPGLVGGVLLRSFGPFGDSLLAVFGTIDAALWDIASSAGPAAPIVIAAVYITIMALSFRLARSVAGEIPILSTAVDFVGLR